MTISGSSGNVRIGVACPIKAGHHASIKCDLFLQGTADGLDNISFDLSLNTFRINDLSAIMNDIYFCHLDIAGRPIHFYFDARSSSASSWIAALPFSFFESAETAERFSHIHRDILPFTGRLSPERGERYAPCSQTDRGHRAEANLAGKIGSSP